MPSSYTKLVYHIVFSTKNRHPWIGPEVGARLHEYLGGAVRSEGGSAYLVNGVADHVHLLVRLRQDKALSAVIRDIKANSSGWIHDTFPELKEFAWQSGYSAFTVSQSQVERVRQYIAGQEGHHRRRTFKEELVALLKAHDIEFEESRLWE